MTRSIGFRGDVRLDGALVLVLAALCASLSATAASASGPASAPARTTLVVRLYDGVGLAGRDLHEAGRVAADILSTGSVDVRWKLCPRSVTEPDTQGCRQPLAANEAVLRLIPAASSMSNAPASLGFTLLDPRGRRAVLSTVFMNRVADVARRARVDTAVLTGRAIAHEIGHLLLGTSGHAQEGLMRAFWSDDALRSQSGSDWQLMPAEVDAIRQGHSQPAELDVTGGS